MDPKVKKITRKLLLEDNPLAVVDWVGEVEEGLKQATEAISGLETSLEQGLEDLEGRITDIEVTSPPEAIIGPKGERGEIGPMPVAGIDFSLPNDGKDGYTPIKGVDYFDGLPGKDGQSIVGPKGDKGDPGQDAPILTPDEVIEAIKSLKGNDRLDISHLRNGEQLARSVSRGTEFNGADQRWHGGGGDIAVKDDGVIVTNKVKSFNFTGDVAVTDDGSGNVSVAITGGGGGGTVTSVSVATANGFSGTVANPTTTPEITISSSVFDDTMFLIYGTNPDLPNAVTMAFGSYLQISGTPTSNTVSVQPQFDDNDFRILSQFDFSKAASFNAAGITAGEQRVFTFQDRDGTLALLDDLTGYVVGPASAADNAIARYDGTTGKIIQNSGAFITDLGNISANNLSGTNTGDQTITLTGDVTGSGTGSFAATIAANAVTNTKLADMAQATIKGRAAAAGTGDPTDLTAAQVLTILGASLNGVYLRLDTTNDPLTGVLDADQGVYVNQTHDPDIYNYFNKAQVSDIDATQIYSNLNITSTLVGTAKALYAQTYINAGSAFVGDVFGFQGDLRIETGQTGDVGNAYGLLFNANFAGQGIVNGATASFASINLENSCTTAFQGSVKVFRAGFSDFTSSAAPSIASGSSLSFYGIEDFVGNLQMETKIGLDLGFSQTTAHTADIGTHIGIKVARVRQGANNYAIVLDDQDRNAAQGVWWGTDTVLYSANTNTLKTDGDFIAAGNIKLDTVGGGFYVKEGANATMGTATLTAGTVTVNTTKVTASSRVFLTVQGGTLTNIGSTYVSARSAGTSFTISSTNILDASNVGWIIIEPA